MKYEFDLITIGLGPAGMAVSVMGAEMGLKVCAIEKHKIGGECMNVGCIPSKALLEIARKQFVKKISLQDSPFSGIQRDLDFIGEHKTKKMFEKVHLVLDQGEAEFVNKHTVKVGEKTYSAKKIFIATGTKPLILPIKGINDIDYLTNENIFKQDSIPKSLTIIGGGAIGAEMAQAFARLGTDVTIVQYDSYLVPAGDRDAGELLQSVFDRENIKYLNERKIIKTCKENELVAIETDKGEKIISEKLLIAAGRKIDMTPLKLENAGVKTGTKGEVIVNKYLQTNVPNIYAVGDCNGKVLLSHAAMMQGMIGIMNSMMPFFMMQNIDKYFIPWTVFTDPQVSYVGISEKQLKEKNIKYDTVKVNYADYGAAIAEKKEDGFVKVFVSKFGKIYGASIVGYGSGEMINEWALAIQKNIKLYDIMMLAHSFPTMGFLTKRVAEVWMMEKMKQKNIQWMLKLITRLY